METSDSPSLVLPKGFIPVMLTPFLDSGEIDFPGLKLLTELYIKAGATGLFANCLSSEMYELTPDERIAITQTVLDQAAGRVPVVATGTFGGPISEQAAFVKRIYGIGVQAVIVITGLMVQEEESDDVFIENVKELLAATPGVPLGFYECPVPYKRVISSKILDQLLPSGRIVYHKDTCLDAVEVKKRIEAGKDYNFGLYDAYMVNAVSSLSDGAAGLSCIQGNIYPELITWICDNYNNTEADEQRKKVQQFFVDSMDLVHTAYPTIAKYSLQKRGLPISLFTRRDIEELTPELKTAMDQLLVTTDKLYQEIGIKGAFAAS
tara:strand:+ start:161 stop:1123 length:963 start_codon:yes stop_codon:yes gene_type:complete